MTGHSVIHGDCIEVLKVFPENLFDAVITDPPYGLKFMGKEWDSFKIENQPKRYQKGGVWQDVPNGTPMPKYAAGLPFQSWCFSWATECLRVLKTGGFLLAFGGTRTHHRLTCALEDAGFIIRDELVWGYCQGFPKAQALDKLIDQKLGVENEREVTGFRDGGAGNTENSAYVQQKRQALTEHKGTGMGYLENQGIIKETAPASVEARRWVGWKTPALKPAWEPIILAQKPCVGSITENVLKHGVGGFNIDACRIPYENESDLETVKQQDNSFLESETPTGNAVTHGQMLRSHLPSTNEAGRFPANLILTDAVLENGYNKFFLIPKTSAAEKHEDPFGDLLNTPDRFDVGCYGDGIGKVPKVDGKRPTAYKNFHPTVKPIALMRHLIKLVTREGQLVLDPFAGSGTTILACRELRRDCVAIEKSKEYCGIAKARFGKTLGVELLLEEEAKKEWLRMRV